MMEQGLFLENFHFVMQWNFKILSVLISLSRKKIHQRLAWAKMPQQAFSFIHLFILLLQHED